MTGSRDPDSHRTDRKADRSGLESRVPSGRALARAIEVIAAFVAEFEPATCSPEDGATLVELFCRAERLAGAGKTLAAARVAESNRPAQGGHRSAGDWLAKVSGQPLGQAIDELRLGAALAHQPDVDGAYRAGRLSRPAATQIAAAAEVNPARGKDLVESAEHDTFRQLKERCLRARAEGLRPEDEAHRAAALHRARRCRTWSDPEGAFRLDAALPPAVGAALAATLAAETNRQFERARKSGDHEPHEAYAADALCALVTGRDYLGPGEATRRKRDPKAQVTLRVDLAGLRRGRLGRGEVCEIPGVGPVPLTTAREMLGDALVSLVVTDGVGVATVCRLGRSIPSALRTALVERDRTCVVPGCDRAVGLEIDHWQVPVADKGPTSMDNLCRLCSYHHDLRTHRGFTLSGGPGHWVFTPPATPKEPAPKRRRASTRSRTAPMSHSVTAVARASIVTRPPPRRALPPRSNRKNQADPDPDPEGPPFRPRVRRGHGRVSDAAPDWAGDVLGTAGAAVQG